MTKAELIELSSAIHTHPELAFQEHRSSALLCDTLAAHGFTVKRGIGGLETVFRAEACGASDGPTIAFLAEYNALPEIGHACGHNIIGAAAVAAGIGVQAVLDQLHGRVIVIGTPAEEGGGGKVILLERGVFEGMLPNGVMAQLFADNWRSVGAAIIAESGLSYLGFGVQPSTPTWGNMLQHAQSELDYVPWTAIFPACSSS